MTEHFGFKPVIIIGAPRSGTNMLRDLLCNLDGVGTWPCDEINYIWRHGNIGQSHDDFDQRLASPKIIAYIRACFSRMATRGRFEFLVEKTCANSLRVPFVDKVIPEARYIFIVRNGLDALASANLRWKAPIDPKYLYQKARYVPPADLPYYAVRYLGNRIYRLLSKNKRLAYWGPQFIGIEEQLQNYSLQQICALQWKRCVESARRAFEQMPADKVIRVSYEKFVGHPQAELGEICRQLEIPVTANDLQKVVSGVTNANVGKWRMTLTEDDLKDIYPHVGGLLEDYGYSVD